MPLSELRWIKQCAEYVPRSLCPRIRRGRRGIYVLFRQTSPKQFEVVYIGMAAGPKAGMRGRVARHHQRFSKATWTHFSIYEVWDNIAAAEVAELEGLLRHIFRRDPAALAENRQRGFRKIRRVRQNKLEKWS